MPPDPAQPGGGSEAPAPEDRLRVEHMLRCSRDAGTIVGTDDAATLGADMVRTRAVVNCFT